MPAWAKKPSDGFRSLGSLVFYKRSISQIAQNDDRITYSRMRLDGELLLLRALDSIGALAIIVPDRGLRLLTESLSLSVADESGHSITDVMIVGV